MFAFIYEIITRPIANLLFVIFNYVGDFGVAIIIFTIIVKFAMWPLVRKQFRQMRLMRKIQPELAEIRKNCKGNRTMEQIQMLDLYKRNNVKPFSSILTLVIQLPIFIALFFSINVIATPPREDQSVEMTAYSFVRDLPRIQPIIEDQRLHMETDGEDPYEFKPKLFGIINLNARAIEPEMTTSSYVVLLFALASAASQYWVTRQTMPTDGKKRTFREIMKEASSGKDPDQAEINAVVQGQMTKFMPVMMFLIMVNLIGAISFYYFMSNIITIIQQRIMLKKDMDDLDHAADKAILKELKSAEEAVIVKETSGKNKNKNITRITATNKKRRKK